MCGRFVRVLDDDGLMRVYNVATLDGPGLDPSWNVAPTQLVRGIVARQEPTLATFKWGLVPSWAKDPSIGTRMINARVETLLEKPAFRKAATTRRMIVPMSGYYEWQAPPAGAPKSARKTPYYLTDPESKGLAAAGLFEFWKVPATDGDHRSPSSGVDTESDGLGRSASPPFASDFSRSGTSSYLVTCTIVTTAAPDSLGHIHDRTPLLLPEGDLRHRWLDPELTAPDDVRALLAEIPPPRLTPIEVSPAVGNVRNNTPDLIAPVHESAVTLF
jgi:putative SOS response-associated peptidase YedK